MTLLLAATLLFSGVNPDQDCGIHGRFCYPYWLQRFALHLPHWPPR